MITTSIIILLPVAGYVLGYRKATREQEEIFLRRRVRKGWQR